MKFKKVDYDKVAVAYNEKYGTLYDAPYLAKIDRGLSPCTNIADNIKVVAYKGNKPLKKFLTIDYKELAIAVNKELENETKKVYMPTYIKRVHEGIYSSKLVLEAIEKILGGENG